MPKDSRIDVARRRALAAKRVLVLAAASGFVALLGVARHAHPGIASGSTSHTSRLLAGVSSTAGSVTLGGGSVASPSPATGSSASVASAPVVQTATS